MGNETYNKAKSFISKYGVFYASGFFMAFALKFYYSKAGSDDLGWILAPTVWWVQILSGIPFAKVQHIGYINQDYQFIIAPACAGINFMIIAFSTLICSFTHHMRTVKSRILWLASSLGIVYLYTILVNSLRIIPSIYLLQMDIYKGWITPERIHTVEGTCVYFASLLLLYFIVDEAFKHFKPEYGTAVLGLTGKINQAGTPLIKVLIKYGIPIFLYFAITLGIPFLNGAYRNNRTDFMEHAILITVVCSGILSLLLLLFILRKNKPAQRRIRRTL